MTPLSAWYEHAAYSLERSRRRRHEAAVTRATRRFVFCTVAYVAAVLLSPLFL